jgi:hypothetical protein
MDCQETQESILDSLVESLAAERYLAMENHLARCETCSSFAKVQRTLDSRLAAAVARARLSPAFRSALRKRIQRNPAALWPDFLPDVAHLVGCALVIALSVFLLPFPSRSVILAGLIFTSGTYFLQAALRGALSGLEADT